MERGGNSEIRNFTENIRIFQGSGKLSFSEDNDVVKPCLEEREIELISLFKQLDEYDKGKVFSKAETLAELAAERVAEQKKRIKLSRTML